MVKTYADASMIMKIRQFLVTGRKKPTEAEAEP